MPVEFPLPVPGPWACRLVPGTCPTDTGPTGYRSNRMPVQPGTGPIGSRSDRPERRHFPSSQTCSDRRGSWGSAPFLPSGRRAAPLEGVHRLPVTTIASVPASAGTGSLVVSAPGLALPALVGRTSTGEEASPVVASSAERQDSTSDQRDDVDRSMPSVEEFGFRLGLGRIRELN